MSEKEVVDYGPLTDLVGVWKGDKGMDVAPEPDHTAKSPYYETITFTPSETVDNADSQVLTIVHYHLIVQRKENDKVFHNQTGYWLWDPREKTIMHSFTIPRGLCVLAGGSHDGEKDKRGNVIFEVAASLEDENWGLGQSQFMKKNALTTSFKQRFSIGNGQIIYSQTTMLEIYGKTFEHTDANVLTKQ